MITKKRSLITLFLFLVCVASFGVMVLDPFGFAIGVSSTGLHAVSMFGLCFIALIFWVKTGKIVPAMRFLKRFLLIGLLFVISFEMYDQVWLWFANYEWLPLEMAFQYIILETCTWLIIPLFIKDKWFPEIKLNRKGFFILIGVNTLNLGWLMSTGFFLAFQSYVRFYPHYPDPHGWIWFGGKLLSYLLFPMLVTRRW